MCDELAEILSELSCFNHDLVIFGPFSPSSMVFFQQRVPMDPMDVVSVVLVILLRYARAARSA